MKIKDYVVEHNIDCSLFTDRGNKRIRPTEETTTIINTLREAGFSVCDICSFLSVSSMFVYRTLRGEYKLDCKPRKDDDEYIPKIDKGKILALHKAGWCIKDIADDCYVTEDVVIGVLSELVPTVRV